MLFIGTNKTRTLVLFGATDAMSIQLQRAIMIVRCIIEGKAVIGGGAIEMELSKMLREHSLKSNEEVKPLMDAIANSFEIIPRQLCENSGFDSTNILNILREKHKGGNINAWVC